MTSASSLPLYRHAVDWHAFDHKYPPPDIYANTVYKWSADQVRALQNERFLEAMKVGWNDPFYRALWSKAGIQPGDIRGIDDIRKLPTYNTEDIKNDQEQHPPFGSGGGFPSRSESVRIPMKLQSSGGTTGKPRLTLQGAIEWEMIALSAARLLYIQGGRPGDVMQIPATCSLAMLGWGYYLACHHYLGILPITSGSGLVTPTRRQLEIAETCSVNCWMSFPEYLIRLAKGFREEFGRDIRDLNTKFITSFLGPDIEGTLRAELQDIWGCPVYDNYGTNEIGAGAFECQHRKGLHLMEDVDFFEVLDVETNEPVAPGGVGNLVVTCFYRTTQPVIRFNLRDLGRIIHTDTCECGSNFRRMDHFLGRSDNMVRLRGVNIYSMACLPAVRSDPRTNGEWICEVVQVERDGRLREEMTVHIEVRKTATGLDQLKEHLEARLKTDLGVSVAVNLTQEGALDSNAHLGEGKASRLIDRRPGIVRKP